MRWVNSVQSCYCLKGPERTHMKCLWHFYIGLILRNNMRCNKVRSKLWIKLNLLTTYLILISEAKLITNTALSFMFNLKCVLVMEVTSEVSFNLCDVWVSDVSHKWCCKDKSWSSTFSSPSALNIFFYDVNQNSGNINNLTLTEYRKQCVGFTVLVCR